MRRNWLKVYRAYRSWDVQKTLRLNRCEMSHLTTAARGQVTGQCPQWPPARSIWPRAANTLVPSHLVSLSRRSPSPGHGLVAGHSCWFAGPTGWVGPLLAAHGPAGPCWTGRPGCPERSSFRWAAGRESCGLYDATAYQSREPELKIAWRMRSHSCCNTVFGLLNTSQQCCGSGSGIRIRIQSGQWTRNRIRIRNPDPDPGGQKWPTKIGKVKKFNVLKCWMFSFESWRRLL